MAQTVKRLPTMQETSVRSLGREDLLEKEMATTPVFLLGKSYGRRSLVGYSPWDHKESDITERLHFQISTFNIAMGLPWWLSGKESGCNTGKSGDVGSIPGLGRSPGEGNGNPLQYFCLENPMEGGAW